MHIYLATFIRLSVSVYTLEKKNQDISRYKVTVVRQNGSWILNFKKFKLLFHFAAKNNILIFMLYAMILFALSQILLPL